MIGLPRVKAGIDCVWGKRGGAGGLESKDTHTVQQGWAGGATTTSPMRRTRKASSGGDALCRGALAGDLGVADAKLGSVTLGSFLVVAQHKLKLGILE